MSLTVSGTAPSTGLRLRVSVGEYPSSPSLWDTDCNPAMSPSSHSQHRPPIASTPCSPTTSEFPDLVPNSTTETTGEEETVTDLALADHSPASSHAHRPPADYVYFQHQPKSLAGIAIRAFCLGITFTIGLAGTLVTLAYTASPLWRLPFFFATLALFHFLEFWTTAAYNTRAAEVSSFLLTSNWPGYAIAHTFALLECLATTLLWPDAHWLPLPAVRVLIGLALVALGQAVRTAAMVQAGQSFNHMVQKRRNSGHVLVTEGVYGWLRHPSYFGFFWWALGTQLVMGNVVTFVGFAVVLWRFFSGRIRVEEEWLVRFFGDEYVDYRRRVGTLIPFVR